MKEISTLERIRGFQDIIEAYDDKMQALYKSRAREVEAADYSTEGVIEANQNFIEKQNEYRRDLYEQLREIM